MTKTRKRVVFWSIVGALMIAVAAIAMTAMDPPPPDEIAIATGVKGDAYNELGTDLGRRIEELDGPSATVLPTRGSVENVQKLVAGDVDVAFVQGGVISALRQTVDVGDLRAIARIYSEPLWVFHRADKQLAMLSELRGSRLRVAIGPDGSGTQVIARELLAQNAVGPADVQLVHQPVPEAVAAFARGEIDVVFVVGAPTAASVKTLLHDRDARPMSFFNHRAYAQRIEYLRAIEIGPGQLSLEQNLPAEPLVLLAPSATLVVRASLHSRVVQLLARAAMDRFSRGNLVDLAGEFPVATKLEIPQHEAARRYMAEGESWFARHVPFWAILWLERLLLVLIPVAAVLLPALRVVPAFINWRVQQIIKAHYETLAEVDARMRAATTPAELERAIEASEQIEEAMKSYSRRVPGRSLDRLYAWRMHINMVQAEALARLRELRGDKSDAANPYGTLNFAPNE